jgi:hypothetical protein
MNSSSTVTPERFEAAISDVLVVLNTMDARLGNLEVSVIDVQQRVGNLEVAVLDIKESVGRLKERRELTERNTNYLWSSSIGGNLIRRKEDHKI